MRAIRLRTEYLNDPMGIDIVSPRFFWNCEGGREQTAWQVICREGGAILWDSGKIAGSSMRCQYPHSFISRQKITWQVRLWDEGDLPGDWSEEAYLEMGLLRPSDWQAKWITGDYIADPKKPTPVDCFRKTFTIPHMGTARLYITACGLYEAAINGQKTGAFVLAPGHTDYRKRIQYQTIDVTGLLREGENTLEIQLASGWYRGSCGGWGIKNQYGTETKILAQLELEGNCILTTDESWDWSNDGPIRFADNQDGEIVDARMTPGYGGKAKATSHDVVPAASNNFPVLEQERFQPKVITTPTGATVLDFGQNIAGYVEFTIQAKAGQRVFLRFGEMLMENGEFTQHNFQGKTKEITTPLQQVEYFCKDGENHYKTKFAVFGFQYVLLETDAPWKPENFTSIAVYTGLEQTGFFDCSHPLLNRFFEATIWSSKGNFLDLPTDCPTRERHGWTGDAQIFFDTASYLFDYAAFSNKHLRDIYDWQEENGNLPQIAPPGGVDSYMFTMNGSAGWSDIGIFQPYRFWKKYGDRKILEDYYPGMLRYAAFLESRCGKKILMSKPLWLKPSDRKFAVNAGQSYGEWAEPRDVFPGPWWDMILPHPEVSTAYTAWCFRLLSEVAAEMSDGENERKYAALSEKVKKSYQALRRKKAYTLDTDRQAMLARPLALDLLDEEQTAYAKKRLRQALINYGWRLGTGFLTTPLILGVLETEDAYRLLENEEMPGWLYMIKAGATTVWEHWDGPESKVYIGSLNHYSKGAVCQWFFDTMCGIRLDGENRFVIAPTPGGSLTCAKCSYQSIYGKVESGWEKKDGKTVYTVTVPANCTARIKLPGGKEETLSSGTHIFEQ